MIAQSVTRFVKELLIPGSMSFLLGGLAIGVLLLDAGAPLFAQIWLTGLVVLYWLMSLPVVAGALIASLHHGFSPLATRDAALDARVIVVIGNGSVHFEAGAFAADMLTRRSYFCVFEAARLWRLLEPEWVLVSGGIAGLNPRARSESELMRDALIGYQVPADRILLESASRTTGEQIANVDHLLTARSLPQPVVVVTTGAHMGRVMALVRTRGIVAVPSVTPGLRYDDNRTGLGRWCPSFAALAGSQSALYEYLAQVYRMTL